VIKELLEAVYKDISDWLKFIEAKNAAALTFNGVLIFGYFRVLNSNFYEGITIPFNLGVIFCILSILISLGSFLPRLTQSLKLGTAYATNKTNFRFYGDIHELSPINYINGIIKYYETGQDLNSYKKEDLDLAIQIVTVSKITILKAKYFKWSSIITLINILIVPLLVILSKYCIC
jgi:hypothetical protein